MYLSCLVFVIDVMDRSRFTTNANRLFWNTIFFVWNQRKKEEIFVSLLKIDNKCAFILDTLSSLGHIKATFHHH